MSPEALRILEMLALVPHPEGGHYREIFRSPHDVTCADGRVRPALTVIYFMLANDERSRWHRLASDETWHFARGDALAIDLIAPSGAHETLSLGPDGPWEATIRPEPRLRRGSWRAASLSSRVAWHPAFHSGISNCSMRRRSRSAIHNTPG